MSTNIEESVAVESELTAYNMVRLIDAAIFTPMERGWGAPLLLEAEPGCAKTSLIRQRFAFYGLPLEILSPGERGEAAFGVVPVPVDGYLKSLPPGWAEKFNGQASKMWPDGMARGGICVDELKSAPPALHPPLLGLMLDGRVGEYTFDMGIRFLGLTNPAGLAAYGQDISAANANRFWHVPYALPSVEENNAFALGVDVFNAPKYLQQGADPVAIEKRVIQEWRDYAWAEACGLVNGLLVAQPHLKNQCPPEGDPRVSGPWASDRTWMFARRAIATSRIHKLNEVESHALLAGCVGPGPADTVAEYAADVDMPNIKALLDGKPQYLDNNGKPVMSGGKPKEWLHNPDRIDRTAAVLSGCAATVVPGKAEKRAARGKATWKLLDDLIQKKCAMDIMVPCATALLQASPILIDQAAQPVLAAMEPMLAAAGVTYEG